MRGTSVFWRGIFIFVQPRGKVNEAKLVVSDYGVMSVPQVLQGNGLEASDICRRSEAATRQVK